MTLKSKKMMIFLIFFIFDKNTKLIVNGETRLKSAEREEKITRQKKNSEQSH